MIYIALKNSTKNTYKHKIAVSHYFTRTNGNFLKSLISVKVAAYKNDELVGITSCSLTNVSNESKNR